MTGLDRFENRLLGELRAVVEQREHPAPPAARPRPRRGPWAVAVAAAAAVAGALVLVPTLQAEPAFAVSQGAAGRVDVQVNRIEDADGLERALAAEGITADVTYLADGGQCAPGRYAPLDRDDLLLSIGSDRSFRVRLGPGAVAQGEVLVIAASWVRLPDARRADGSVDTEGFRTWVDLGVTDGPVAPCVVERAGR
jgi:hypothetical protein